MNGLNEYRELMTRLFKNRHQNATPEIEAAILDQMDLVWHRMSGEQRKTADELSQRVASGEISEEQFIVMYAKAGRNFMPNEQQQTQIIHIQITTSPVALITTASSSGVAIQQATRYFGFVHPLESLHITPPRRVVAPEGDNR